MSASKAQRLPFRQVHMDFHTSEAIPDIGVHCDPQQFAATLRDAQVNAVTLFARGHHGWCYYPTTAGVPHPHLRMPDLLGDLTAACRAQDIDVAIYHSVQWDERIAREFPQWRAMPASNAPFIWPNGDTSMGNQLTPTWHPICLAHEGYVQYLEELTREVLERYHPPRLFFDILLSWECVCPVCLEEMQRIGRDPENGEDRRRHDRDVMVRFTERMSRFVASHSAETSVFYNSGNIFRGDRERYRSFGHLEIESLPTGGWGYDHFPLSARYADFLRVPFLGMTGKFHTSWGEFGGYKEEAALIYECMHMIALGARCSIGDQLHPDGRIDAATYRRIAPAYDRVARLEEYIQDARYQCDVAILSSAAFLGDTHPITSRHDASDEGAAQMLLEMQIPFDVIDVEADFSIYRVILLPDTLRISRDLAQRLHDYLDCGGKIIASYESGLDTESGEFQVPLGVNRMHSVSPWHRDYIAPRANLLEKEYLESHIMYAPPLLVEAADGAETLADLRRPYFNRSWKNFCSHQHSPVVPPEQEDAYGVAILRTGHSWYFAHPVFRLYHEYGQPYVKRLVRAALDDLFEDTLITTSLTSAGRASVMKDDRNGRYVVHLLYAPTQIRGRRVMENDGTIRAIETIEDVPTLADVECSVRVEGKVRNVYVVPEKHALPWKADAGSRVSFVLSRLHIHAAVIIETD